jgi:hypothetical protein
MNLKTNIDFFVFFIIFIKIVFVITAVSHFILSHTQNASLEKNLDPRMIYWKERTEFIFIASMSVLLIYYFRPGHEQTVNKETSFLFFLFGCILLFTAKWSLFFTEAPWYKLAAQTLA